MAYKCGYKTGYQDVCVTPSRCNCAKAKKCDCYIFDDGANALSNIINNNTTLVHGAGLPERPYYVQNIHHPSFIPPAAKVRTLTASPASTLKFITFNIVDFNTDSIFNSNQPDRFTITRGGVYTFGASIQWGGPPDLYTNFGIYAGRSGSFFGADPSAASPAAISDVQYTANKATPGQTISRIAPYSASFTSSYYFQVGDFLKVGVFGANPPNPGATSCSFWICYT